MTERHSAPFGPLGSTPANHKHDRYAVPIGAVFAPPMEPTP
jgi:hypothetical protein